jgi:lysylphosphatidylglycerol synthetase-like protein (DUF2156 family)/UDP-2,3-diacylglucosamine pyrophosphatase LpxH
MAAPEAVPAVVQLDVAAGSALWFASDLHLGTRPSDAIRHITRALDGLPPRSVVMLGGDVLELLDAPEGTDPAALLSAHPKLVEALERARRERDAQVVWLIGNHDVRLMWDSTARAGVQELLPGCRFALAADVGVPTGAGIKRVWCEHGNQSDRFNRFSDPSDPHDTPVGHHIVREVLPTARALLGGWIDDASALAVPTSFPTFVTSRLFYRRFLARWRWALGGMAGLFVLRLAASIAAWTAFALARRIVELALLAILDAIVAVLIVAVAAHRTATRIAEAPALAGARGLNRRIAEDLTSAHPGYAGVVTGHTHVPELRDQAGERFYANPGCSGVAVRAVPAVAGLPSVFQRSADVGWVLVAGGPAGVEVELYHGSAPDERGMTVVERWLGRRRAAPTSPRQVAAWPSGPTTMPKRRPLRTRTVRRAAALGVAASAAVTIASALLPPEPERLVALRRLVPLAYPLAATGATVVVGVALAVLALGLARGQRRAYRATVVLLAAATAGHMVKGVDVEEAMFTGSCLAALLAVRRRFTVPAVREGLVRRVALLAGVVLAGVAVGIATLELSSVRPLGGATALAFRELLGFAPIPPRGSDGRFVAAALLGLGLAAVLVTAGLVLQRPCTAPAGGIDPHVRHLVMARGTDSLAYFALRADKDLFSYGDSVVAYRVFGRVALVSPDPIGPPGDLEHVVTAFRAEAVDRGWILAILGAAPEPTRRYEALGLRSLYLGDEAIARFDNLDLRGNRYRRLRGAVNRAVKAGYSVELLDPAALTGDQRAALDVLVAAGRRGEAERGFSMTLGRLFDPRDEGLLLAVAWGPDGRPGALCQFVPASDVGGWSLDVMRRDPDTPSGLMDFLLVETMRRLKDQGCTGLALNFATMRTAVDPGAQATSPVARVERRVLHSLSEMFQIESLWQFNAKYDPEWRPRFLVYESPAHLPEIAVAVARAESFWEIPVVGRFLRPDEPRPPRAAAEII